MMPKFVVSIQKIVTTDVAIEAKSAAEARRKIEEYGLTEAASDFVQDDTVTERISAVARCSEPE